MGNDDAMKILALWLMLIPAVLMAQPNESVPTINVEVPCNDWEYVQYNILQDYQELPVAKGKAAINTKVGVLSGITFTFINPETKSFTVVLRVGEGEGAMACVILAGDDFGPVFDKEALGMMGDIEL